MARASFWFAPAVHRYVRRADGAVGFPARPDDAPPSAHSAVTHRS